MGEEKTTGAFFDVDYTILSSNSASLFVKYLRQEGMVGIFEILSTLYYVIRYKLDLLDFERLAAREVAKMAGRTEAEMIELCDRWFKELVIHYIYPEARARIKSHQDRGEPVVLLSAATVYLVRPLALHLGVEHYLCNYLEVDDRGVFTGELKKPFCYGVGKVHWAEDFAAREGVDLERSKYYSDSVTDMPVLERFGEPVAVNPDLLLRKQAKKRGWPILDWRMPGK